MTQPNDSERDDAPPGAVSPGAAEPREFPTWLEPIMHS